jgi:GntR family carbon starvation induced transcriptional regulator
MTQVLPYSPAPNTPVLSAETLAARAASALQRAILSGELAPDSKLVIHDLAERFSIGTTPIREGLSRLVTLGLVLAIGQRGFRVARLSREDLEDIIRVRTLIEVEALRLSMQHGGDEWEAGIVAGIHRLRRFLGRSDSSIHEGSEEFDANHKAFHTALIAGCGSMRMIEQHRALYDQAYRYRRIMMHSFPSAEDFEQEHQDLADLALARDFKQASERLGRHLAYPLTYVYGGEAP